VVLAAAFAALVLGGALTAACAVNPATGERQLSLIGEGQEIEMGRQTAAQVEATMGLYDDADLQAYVEEIGLEMARASERPDLPWSFEVADEPVINAFAAPGGFIFFTRGILAHFNSEAEMAAVLGHEIGHVTARHSVERLSKQQLAQVGLGVGAVLSDEVAAVGDVLGAGLGVLFLKFSRDDERQSDRLGFRYMTAEGYDPREMADVFQMFRRMSEAQDGGGVPGWLSTHPTPADRIEEIRAMVDSVPSSRLEGTRVGREAYLEKIDGLVYGPDPRNGFFQGNGFVHPGMEFRLEFPDGWQRVNMARMVAAVSPEEDAQVQLMLADAGSPQEAARSFLDSDGVEGGGTDRTSINGFPAEIVEFRAQGQQGVLRGLAAFLQDGSRVFRLLGLTPEDRYRGRASAFRRFVGSYARLTDREALNAEPMRVELVTPDRATTLTELARRRGGPLSVERLALLNALDVDETIPAGRTIKWVTGELPQAMREGGP
jgi:predicted Zn-dependent protease